MTEEKTETVVTVETPNPPASLSSSETPRQAIEAETVIEAALQTGAAAEKAQEAASKATDLLEEIRAEFRPQIQEILERLETMEEEENPIGADTSNSPGDAIAAVVALEEPRVETPKPSTDQKQEPPAKKQGGGLFKKFLLNL